MPEDRRVVRRWPTAAMSGQGYEVRFDVPPGEIDDRWLTELGERFHQAHEAEYGHHFDSPNRARQRPRGAIGQIPDCRPSALSAETATRRAR